MRKTLPQKIAAYLRPILKKTPIGTLTTEDLFRLCCEGGFGDAKRSDLEAAIKLLLQDALDGKQVFQTCR